LQLIIASDIKIPTLPLSSLFPKKGAEMVFRGGAVRVCCSVFGDHFAPTRHNSSGGDSARTT